METINGLRDSVPNWLPCGRAAQKLGIGLHAVYRAIRLRKIGHRRLGGRLWIDLSEAKRVLIREVPATVEGLDHAE